MHQVTGSGLTGKKGVLIPDKSIRRDYKEMFQGFVLFCFVLFNTTGVGYFAMPRMILTGGLLGSYEGEQPGELLR